MRPSVPPPPSCFVWLRFQPLLFHLLRTGGEGKERGATRAPPPPLLVALAMRRGGGAEEMDRILDTLRLHVQLWGSFRPLI